MKSCVDAPMPWLKSFANLKKLADAWAPLYQTLNPDQKERMRFLVTRVLHDVQVGAATRRMEMYDEDR